MDRVIKLEGMQNFRDVGGLGKLSRGVVYRCDDPVKATAADKAEIAKLNIRTVIDLRTDVEVEAKGHESFGAQRLLCDLPPNAKVVAKTIGVQVQMGYAKGPKGMAEANELLLREGKSSIARALRAIAAPGGVPCVVHCSSGKDRTGLLVMLLLSFLGVDEEEIVSDYALTAKFLPVTPDAEERTRQMFTRYTGKAVTDDQVGNVLSAYPESARLTLAMFYRVHGGVDAYLTRVLGLSDTEVTSLRRALTSPPPPPKPKPASPRARAARSRVSVAWRALGLAGAAFGLISATTPSVRQGLHKKKDEERAVKAKL